jgi:HAD superfamily hydrolase (TIGR01484 family)
MKMRQLSGFTAGARLKIKYVLMDIDDTLTLNGRLPAAAYGALELLWKSGFKVVPITGRPAGWCDHIARMWPVDGVVGENGAFYFHYDDEKKKMICRYWKSAEERTADRLKLNELCGVILAAVPGAKVAADQAYRDADLAIDFCEDVPRLPESDILRIVELFESAGARAKISSIHVNGWFGDYDKLTMTKIMFNEIFGVDIESGRDAVVFAGDSPNDAPMFKFFPNATGVANVAEFKEKLRKQDAEPAWITDSPGGFGFAELAEALLAARG